ncbi:MAG: Crp/Fnr family transcriptional regulator, partial [Epsilonproteobacteria bacterium]
KLKKDMHIKKYTKKSIVFYEEDKSEYLHLLLEGSVKMYKTNPKGSHIHMHDFHAPDIIAIFASIKDIPFPATCELTSDGVIGIIPLKKLYDCMKDADFSLAVTKSLANKMELLASLLQRETIYSSEAKVAELIHDDITIFKRLKNNEIASILNIAPATLSRTLTKFKKEKIIADEEYIVRALDKDKLLEIVETNIIPSREEPL